jgi:hypothetical protein
LGDFRFYKFSTTRFRKRAVLRELHTPLEMASEKGSKLRLKSEARGTFKLTVKDVYEYGIRDARRVLVERDWRGR